MLSLLHKTIPATLHCQRPHPRFKFDASPFYPICESRPWTPVNGVRRAAISSFGFGGTNCHLILEEGMAIEEKNAEIDKLMTSPSSPVVVEHNPPVVHFVDHDYETLLKQIEQGEMTSDEAIKQLYP